MNGDARFNNCDVAQELPDNEIDRRLEEQAAAAEAAEAAAAAAAAAGGSDGPARKLPPPPPTWVWPREGDEMQVEVEDDDGTKKWHPATVTAVLVDSWVQMEIHNPPASPWLDWFTWEEEGTDWRRRARGAVKGRGAAAAKAAKAKAKVASPVTDEMPRAKKKRRCIRDDDSDDESGGATAATPPSAPAAAADDEHARRVQAVMRQVRAIQGC